MRCDMHDSTFENSKQGITIVLGGTNNRHKEKKVTP